MQLWKKNIWYEETDEGVLHLVGGGESASLLTRYQVVTSVPAEGGGMVEGEEKLTYIWQDFSRSILPVQKADGFSLTVFLSDRERLFGLGDESRETVMKRGRIADLWVRNAVCYGPVPFLISSENWALFVNCTYRMRFDLDSQGRNQVHITAEKGILDCYLFLGEDMKSLIGKYTKVTGRPLLLPRAGYGFTFVCNEEEGAHDVVNDCFQFRREEIPCDMVGLEPGWMETHYDFTTKKEWHPERFYFPTWVEKNYAGTWSFLYNVKQMGFRLSLWLCCDYDLLWEEEQEQLDCRANSYEGAEIMDDHFGHGSIMDKITVPGESWFTHLKRFVDQGVSAFKMDGANQVLEHPDRLWACRYTDDEIHNLYPVLLAKQMSRGFSEYTGRRAMIYTSALYAGTQRYAATWAGDTGGGPATLVSILNYAFCGHTNTTCDIDPSNVKSLHYGFLLPWSQILAWRNWHHPWLLGRKQEAIIRDYARLRSSLFPYLYSFAYAAWLTGIPIIRPMQLEYPQDERYDQTTNLYMLGDSLLVGAFDMNLSLPEGKWIDYFTNVIYSGEITYEPPAGKGGALFVKPGAVFVTQTPKDYLDEETEEPLYIRMYPGGSGSFLLYEDDGDTMEYQKDIYAVTKMAFEDKGDGTAELTLFPPEGGYPQPSRSFRAVFPSEQAAVFCEEVPVKVCCQNGVTQWTAESGEKPVTYRIQW
ncbi:glycoside hydrolase family 31 protein [Ructibacterium gallinarum]|uniref:Glycoside hydrolase family 31 protein n=1 Tax=Ructibacterium gallinarum TaxID=2779355 RepID=A0A9D5M1J8_9FIRM|nr:TIM-barrel domain-containing protein [Ructibacterium gallinarum]MBE5038984.1 glycoside hydrolase family 31 protein [Ructibacterium gallinarum]